MEKYSRVFHFDDPLYLKNSPLVILAGAILKNNETDEVVAQLKLKNISNSKIKAVEVLLTLYDPAGEVQEKKINYDFLDLNIYRNGEFGSKEAISLPYKNTRSFDIFIKKVIFDNDEVWTNNKKYYKLSKQKKLNTILESTEIDYFKKKFGDNSEFVPYVEKDIWYCCCGNINTIEEKKCYCCGVEKSNTSNIDFEKIKIEALYDLSNNYLETSNYKLIKEAKHNFEVLKEYKDSKMKIDECINKLNELSNKNKKNKKIAVFMGIITVLIIITGIVLTTIFNNRKMESRYEEANKLFNEKKYSESIIIFDELGIYKDSKSKKIEAENELIYLKAEDYFDNGQFYSAYLEYKTINKYKDSSEKEYLSKLYYTIKNYNDNDSETFFNQNIENFKLINDENQIRKIFVNKWLVGMIHSTTGLSVEIFNEDGTGYRPNAKTFKDLLWKVENGYLYYTFWSKIYDSDKSEFREVVDGVYLLVSAKNKEAEFIFILHDSEISQKLNLEGRNS